MKFISNSEVRKQTKDLARFSFCDIINLESHLASYSPLFIEPNRLRKLQSKVYKTTVTRLKYLRFSLLNILNNIQHYIFGYIYNKCLNRFELNFEKSSDLKTLMVAHSEFIHSFHKAIINVLGTNDSQTGFYSIIRSVKLLNNLWNDIAIASNEKLADCYAHYKTGFKVIDPVVNPVYIYDY